MEYNLIPKLTKDIKLTSRIRSQNALLCIVDRQVLNYCTNPVFVFFKMLFIPSEILHNTKASKFTKALKPLNTVSLQKDH